MEIYKVVYDDDLCYHYVSWFFNLKDAKNWCKMNKHSWMRWHIYDKEGREKYGGRNGKSYYEA